MNFTVVSETSTIIEDRDPNLYVKRAEDCLKRRDFSMALHEMDKAIEYAPEQHMHQYIFEKIKVFDAIGEHPDCVFFIKKYIHTMYSYLPLSNFYRVVAALDKNLKSTSALEELLSENGLPAVLAATYRYEASRNRLLKLTEEFRAKEMYPYALDCIRVIDAKYYGGYDTCVLRAEIYHEQGDHREAVRFYQKAVALSGATVEVYLEMIGIYRELHELPEAKHWIANALEDFPNHYEILHEKADLLYEEKNDDECLSTLDVITWHFPYDAEAYYVKGIIYDQKEKFFRANRNFKKARSLDKSFVPPQNRRRKKFLILYRLLIITIVAVVLAAFAEQVVLFEKGKLKPIIVNASMQIPDTEILVGTTGTVSYTFTYLPFYAQKPVAELVADHPGIVKVNNEKGTLKGLKTGLTTVKLVWNGKVLATEEVEVIDY